MKTVIKMSNKLEFSSETLVLMLTRVKADAYSTEAQA
jgi:hypothetical protein